jgi:glycosyltransferase involved in cell wall biosynthesis
VFRNAAGPPLAYRDPWCASLEERLHALVTRERRVAYFYEKPEAHTFRYRVFNMVEALDAQPHLGISAAWFARDDLESTLDFVDRADVLVVCRTRYDRRIGQLIARARARGLPIFYDIDDLIFDLRYAHLIGDTINRRLHSSEDWDWWCGYIGRLGLTLQLCDAAITTNAFLGQRISEFAPGTSVKIIPNFLNRWQTSVSRSIYERKFVGRFLRDGHVDIGYFSGTNTHSADFRIAAGALCRMLDCHDNVRLNVVGSLDLPERLAGYGNRVRRFPLQDFINLQRLQGEVEIAIAPTQDNIFTNCKSELKFFEAAVLGTVVVASPTFAFREAIADGETGFLAPAHQWESKLEAALTLLEGDGSGYRSLASRAAAHVADSYAWDRQGGLIAAQVFGDLHRPVTSVPGAGATERAVSAFS